MKKKSSRKIEGDSFWVTRNIFTSSFNSLIWYFIHIFIDCSWTIISAIYHFNCKQREKKNYFHAHNIDCLCVFFSEIQEKKLWKRGFNNWMLIKMKFYGKRWVTIEKKKFVVSQHKCMHVCRFWGIHDVDKIIQRQVWALINLQY